MAKIEMLLKSKFRGCMLGTLLGDCLGAPFEGDPITLGSKLVIQRYFDKLDGPHFKVPYKKYTDDTAMTISVAKSLIDKPDVDFQFMARLFTEQYFLNPHRGYGANIVDVFRKLRESKYTDVYKPAKEQFAGSGSYGNGGAMRIAPIALYFHNSEKAMIDAARKTTEITHTHRLGVHGALLQCIALRLALLSDPTEPIDPQKFLHELLAHMTDIEGEADGRELFQTRLKLMQRLLTVEGPEDPLTEIEISTSLGNGIAALDSVPTAIYCFLRAQKDIPGMICDNAFRRTVQYAVTLGGDTDTIASMAGSLAGVYFGEEYISERLLRHCETPDKIIQMADNLYDVVPK